MNRQEEGWRRLGEADAMYVGVDHAVPGVFTPLNLQVYSAGFPDEDAVDHLREVMARLLPQLRCRLVRDPLSPALPRWVDAPDFDVSKHMVELPTPGDGSLRAILDFAAEWADRPMPPDRPAWRMAFFRDVTIDGVPGRMVSIGQIHHTVIDGEGGKRMADRFLQWGPDEPMPQMPELEPPEDISAFARWREGWAIEGRKLGRLAAAGARRAGYSVRHPMAAARRARELAAAMRRFAGWQGTETLSPLLQRRSERLRFDLLEVDDMPAFKAGARAAGGSVNDGLMAAISLAIRRWHKEQGVDDVTEVRLSMAVNVRPDDGSYGGNELTTVMVRLPVDDDDVTRLVGRCRAISAEARGDRDVLLILDRSLKLATRGPAKAMGRASAKRMKGMDVQMSNVNGIPAGFWMGGVENLRTVAFMGSSHCALQLIIGSSRERADIGITTCPETIRDPDHFVGLLADAMADIAKQAG